MKLLHRRVTTTEIDHALTGRLARSIRQRRGLSLKLVAGRMGFSAMYLSHLERGLRQWSDALVESFRKATAK